jgi:hypothetical protein
MKWLASWSLATLLFSAGAIAADIVPVQEKDRLGVVVTGLQFPETLPKDLTSGLTNRVLIRVSLIANSRQVARQAVDIAIKYDLWDEVFELKMRSNEVQFAPSSLSNLQQVLALLDHLQLSNLFSTQQLTANQEYVATVEILINPIDRERMDKVRKWVADNSAYLPSTPGTVGLGDSVTSARSNELFNKIFEQYSAGADIAAAWRQSVTSKPFKLQAARDAR